MIAELLTKLTTEWAFHAFFVWKLAHKWLFFGMF